MMVRHVRRTGRRRRNGGIPPALVLVCIAFILIVYAIGASKFGTWLAASVVAPAILHSVPLDSPPPTAAATAEGDASDASSVMISIPSLCCYAIQIGVYAQSENADAQADRLREMGAAGYVIRDGDKSRVMAAAYPSEADMEQVRKQLLDEGIDSRAYTISTDGLRFSATGTTEQLARLEAAMSFSAALPEQLSRLAIRFDQEMLTTAGGIEQSDELRTECAVLIAELTELGDTTGNDLLAITAYLADMERGLEALAGMTEGERVGFSSQLKRLYLDAVFAYQHMTEQMDAL